MVQVCRAVRAFHRHERFRHPPAPVGVLLKHYGFTVDNVVAAAKGLLEQ